MKTFLGVWILPSSLPCRSGSCGWCQFLGKLRCSTRAAWSPHFGFPLPCNQYLKLLLQLNIQFLKPVWKYSWLLEWERKTFKSSESCHGPCYLAGCNPKWQPQPRVSQVLFEEFRALFSIPELYLCFVCACETVELQGLVGGCGAFGWGCQPTGEPLSPLWAAPAGWGSHSQGINSEIRAAMAGDKVTPSLSPQGGACRQIGSVWL